MAYVAIALVVIILAGFVAILGATAGASLYKSVMQSRRKWRAMKTGADSAMIWPEEYQPRTIGAAWREPIHFEATKPCPHCGLFDTHNMASPSKADHPGAATIRRCKRCGHVWGES